MSELYSHLKQTQAWTREDILKGTLAICHASPHLNELKVLNKAWGLPSAPRVSTEHDLNSYSWNQIEYIVLGVWANFRRLDHKGGGCNFKMVFNLEAAAAAAAASS